MEGSGFLRCHWNEHVRGIGPRHPTAIAQGGAHVLLLDRPPFAPAGTKSPAVATRASCALAFHLDIRRAIRPERLPIGRARHLPQSGCRKGEIREADNSARGVSQPRRQQSASRHFAAYPAKKNSAPPSAPMHRSAIEQRLRRPALSTPAARESAASHAVRAPRRCLPSRAQRSDLPGALATARILREAAPRLPAG